MQTIKTTLHAYRFDISKPADKTAYAELCERLKPLIPHPMEAYEGTLGFERTHIEPLDGQVIELETEHLFDNQWNTGPTATSDKSLRVFDWHKIAPEPGANPKIRRGYWLEQTDGMRELRRNTMKCGYCGKQEPAAKGYVFCPHCLGSEYLKEADLRLTRMRPIDQTDIRGDIPELTQAERDYLLPLYRAEQAGKGSERSKQRAAKRRAHIIKDADDAMSHARIKRDGLLWCEDHGIRTDNVIYYSHTGRFGFGWRTPLDATELSHILDVISEFPGNYDLTCADGRKLSN